MAARVADTVFAFLLHPRVSRFRRWSSLVTVPLAIVLFVLFGFEGGWALAAAELALLLGVLLLLFRLDPSRREAVLDLVAPPVERRLVRSELAVFGAYVRALRRRREPDGPEWSYHRGSIELALPFALLPAFVGEVAIFHLLLPWFWAKVALAALSAYAFVWLLGWALGLRVYPHRLVDGTLELRLGALYPAAVPLASIETAECRRERVERGSRLVLRNGKAYFVADGRVDVHLSLRAPVVVHRPLGAPVSARSAAVAADRPEEMARAIARRGEPG